MKVELRHCFVAVSAVQTKVSPECASKNEVSHENVCVVILSLGSASHRDAVLPLPLLPTPPEQDSQHDEQQETQSASDEPRFL